MSRKLWIVVNTILAMTILFLFLKGTSIAQTNVSLDTRVYRDLEWLAALGYLPTHIAAIKPLSRLEIAALIIEGEGHLTKDADTSKRIVSSTLSRLKKDFHQEIDIIKGLVPKQNFVKPIDRLRTTFMYQDVFKIPENEYGQNAFIHSNGLIDLSSRGRFLNRIGFQLRPFGLFGDQSNFEFIEAYLHYQSKHVCLGIGKEAFWWGQGTHGTLQLTNNAEPFTMFHLTSNAPFMLPSFLRYLGLCRFSFFITELEKNRETSEPKFSGLKISFKVHPCIEIGLTRTFLFKRWDDFGDALLAKDENTPEGPGNQIGGFDCRITLPFKFQPITLYGERSGEDEAGYLPSAWASLGGIYLPAIGKFSQIRFRAEYADIHHSSHKPNAWYVHGEGLDYTYKGRIMGHHMDNNSKDLYFALEWEPHSKFRIRPAFDYEQRWLKDQTQPIEKQRQYILTVEYTISQYLTISVQSLRELVENKEHSLGENEDNTRTYVSLQLML